VSQTNVLTFTTTINRQGLQDQYLVIQWCGQALDLHGDGMMEIPRNPSDNN